MTVYQGDRKHLEEAILEYNHVSDCSTNDICILSLQNA